MNAKCDECGRIFNLLNKRDAKEFEYNHDCETLSWVWSV